MSNTNRYGAWCPPFDDLVVGEHLSAFNGVERNVRLVNDAVLLRVLLLDVVEVRVDESSNAFLLRKTAVSDEFGEIGVTVAELVLVDVAPNAQIHLVRQLLGAEIHRVRRRVPPERLEHPSVAFVGNEVPELVDSHPEVDAGLDLDEAVFTGLRRRDFVEHIAQTGVAVGLHDRRENIGRGSDGVRAGCRHCSEMRNEIR